MKELLGNRTLKRAQMSNESEGLEAADVQHQVSSDTVTTELIRSEKISFTPVITAVIEFLKSIDYQDEAGNLKRIAQLIMKLILKWCGLNELKEAEASRMPRNSIIGDTTVHEVVHKIIPYGQSNNPNRTMISILLLTRGMVQLTNV